MTLSTLATAALLSMGVALAQPSPIEVARALVPLLEDVRRGLEPKLTVEPGKAPPSPFTGRPSTLIAIRVGRDAVQVEPEVTEAMDRLLAWNRRQPLPKSDETLVAKWFDALRVKVLARLAASRQAVVCDDKCVLRHLTAGGELFGQSKAERQALRNEVLLDALIEAVYD